MHRQAADLSEPGTPCCYDERGAILRLISTDAERGHWRLDTEDLDRTRIAKVRIGRREFACTKENRRHVARRVGREGVAVRMVYWRLRRIRGPPATISFSR